MCLDKRKPEINIENSDRLVIDHLYFLQNFKDNWKSGKWEEKFEIASCEEEYEYVNSILSLIVRSQISL
jgi:hypothetical protein